METLTQKQYQQKLAELQSARANTNQRNHKFAAKTKTNKPWWQSILDFLTY